MFLKPLSAEQRKELKAPATGLALRVQHTGQFAPHDVAKKAGVQKDDILISFNGRTDLTRETDVLAYSLNELKPGSTVPAELLRDGQKISVSLAIGP